MNTAHTFFYVLLAGVALLSTACKQKQSQATPKPEVFLSPEETVRQYQQYLDQNDFEQAKGLSTSKEAVRLDEIAKIVAAESQDSTRTNSVFLKLDCSTQRDTARCTCTIKDQYETYDTDFLLIRFKNKWLIDVAPQEEIIFDEEELERALDGMLEQIR